MTRLSGITANWNENIIQMVKSTPAQLLTRKNEAIEQVMIP